MIEIAKQKVKAADKIIGKPYIPYGLKDNDKDGVNNLLDCQPNNPREQ